MTLTAEARLRPTPPIALGIVVFLFAFAATLLVMWFGQDLPRNLVRFAAVLFVLTLGPFLVLAHEGGHYLMARLLGWRVALFTWGGYTIRLKPWRVRHGSPPFSDASGAVVVIPARESRWGYVAVFGAGPFANLLIALASALAAAFGPSFSAPFFWLSAGFSLFMGVTNLLPWRSGSDGAQIVQVLTERDLRPRTVMARLAEEMIAQVPPRAWPVALMRELMRITLWADYTAFTLLIYIWHMDRGESDAAREVLVRAGSDPEIIQERAFFAVFVDGDVSAAARLLSQCAARPSSLGFWRARAMLAVARGQSGDAREALRNARVIAGRDPYTTVWDMDILDQLEARCRS